MSTLSTLRSVLWLAGSAGIGMAHAAAQPLPTQFVCDQVFVQTRTLAGEPLRFFTDTGGGTWIKTAAATRAGLGARAADPGPDAPQVVDFPALDPALGIPAVLAEADPRNPALRGLLLVLPTAPAVLTADGMLGQEWFAGRVWEFDYAQHTLRLGQGVSAHVRHSVPLGFPVRPDGRRGSQFPSIQAEVAGTAWAWLLDTGASIQLTPPAREALGLAPDQSACGTSFVTASLFARWQADHPEWRVVAGADAFVGGEPMIEVPEVVIAGHRVGPVWFTRRADRNFHDYMSSMMDTRVEGALGGSLFRYFRMTVDYPAARASFERVTAAD